MPILKLTSPSVIGNAVIFVKFDPDKFSFIDGKAGDVYPDENPTIIEPSDTAIAAIT